MKSHISRLEEELKHTRREFLSGRLHRGFYRDRILKLQEAIKIFDSRATPKERDEHVLLRTGAESFLVDALYWIGQNGEAGETVTRLKDCVDEVTRLAESLEKRSVAAKLSRLSPREKNLLREKVRAAINYSLIFEYHEHKYEQAEQSLSRCLELLQNIQDPNLAFLGQRAIVNFHLARVMRNRHRWREAEAYLRSAMDLHLERVEFKKSKFNDEQLDQAEQGEVKKTKSKRKEELDLELAFSRYRVAIFLGLGRGWLNYQAGQLWIALYSNIIPARVSLEETEDLVNIGYLKLFEGCIRRELYVEDEKNLKRALELIIDARENFFKPMEHRRYVELADYEEANTKLFLSMLFAKQKRLRPKKERYIADILDTVQKLKTLALNRKDVRRESHYLTLESRIELYCDEYPEAEAHATEAMKKLRADDRVYRIEALIARSNAYIGQSRSAEAITDLDEARSLNRDKEYETVPVSPRLEAIIHITIVRAYTNKGELKKAAAYLENAKNLAVRVENAIVQKMVREAAKEIEEAVNKDFTIEISDLNIDDNVERLKRRLTELALEATKGDVKKAANLLGKDKSSIFRYRRSRVK